MWSLLLLEYPPEELPITDVIARSTHIEPDGTGTNVSLADKVIGASSKVDWSA